MNRYTTLSAVLLSAFLAHGAVAQQPQPEPQRKAQSSTITFYEQDGYNGRWFSTTRRINNFNRFGFNDAANSVRVRGGRWEVCTAPRFEGRCVVLRRGNYPSLREAGLEDRISSARPVQQGSREWNRKGAYERAQDRR
jgi:hypothetical protein